MERNLTHIALFAALIAVPCFMFGGSGASGQTTGLAGAGVVFGTVAGALAGRWILDGGEDHG